MRDEADELHRLLKSLDRAGWQRATLFKAWTVDDIVRHLHMGDRMGLASATSREAFRILMDDIRARRAEGASRLEETKQRLNGLAGPELLDRWRETIDALCAALADKAPEARLVWAGPDMGVSMFATARQMEIWAHSQAIYDLLGVERPAPSPRLRNIAEIGVRTFGWAYRNRGLPVPPVRPFINLATPFGESWTWNMPSADEAVTGDAFAFCQVVTQTRNAADTDLHIAGPTARHWMSIAQCFAGPPEAPPAPGSRYRVGPATAGTPDFRTIRPPERDMARTPRPIHSDIAWSNRTQIVVRGKSLPDEVIGELNLGDFSYLQLTGRMPTRGQSRVFNAILVTLVEHGLTPSAIAARLTYAGAPESMQAAVAAGLCGLGTVFVGSMETAARLLYETLPDGPTGVDLEAKACDVAKAYADARRILPGVGHPIHKPVDPRAPRLFQVAEECGLNGGYCTLMRLIAREAERLSGKSLPVNATGAIGALCCELGFPWKVVRGFGVMARAVGLVGHIMEEAERPIANEVWLRTEEEASRHVRQPD